MPRIFAFILFLITLQTSFAQFDRGNISVLRLEKPTTTSTFDSSKSTIEYKSMFDKTENNTLKNISIFNQKEEANNLMLPEKVKNPGDIVRDKLNTKDNPADKITNTDIYFGEFKVDTKFVKIICYDHEYPDGDVVMILQNDFTVVPQIVLEANSKEYYVTMVEGFNKIEFVALNQGESGPNTAAFSVFDDQGRLIISNKWNLLTGNKAKLVFVKGKK